MKRLLTNISMILLEYDVLMNGMQTQSNILNIKNYFNSQKINCEGIKALK